VGPCVLLPDAPKTPSLMKFNEIGKPNVGAVVRSFDKTIQYYPPLSLVKSSDVRSPWQVFRFRFEGSRSPNHQLNGRFVTLRLQTVNDGSAISKPKLTLTNTAKFPIDKRFSRTAVRTNWLALHFSDTKHTCIIFKRL